MTDKCVADRATIIVGSETKFTLFLVNEHGRPIDLSQYNAGNLVFCNCAGVRSVIALTIPGSNPGAGEIAVTIPSADAANADAKWTSADVELTPVVGSEKIVLLKNKFEIVERICPPATP